MFFRKGVWFLLLLAVVAGVLLFGLRGMPPAAVTFSQSARTLEAYDFVEITANIRAPHLRNPFRDAVMRGNFATASGNRHWQVEGFCDGEDGSVYRIRFMPPAPGKYTFSAQYRQGWYTRTSAGAFEVTDGHRRGPLRLDSQNRWHFIWEGTGEHYFFNGTTAYWLMGWRDDQVIRDSIERLRRLKINRMRVTIAGRTNTYYGEPVMDGDRWSPFLTPWPAGRGARFLHLLGRFGQRFGMGFARGAFDSLANIGAPDDIYHPGFDYSRFRVSYWQKLERALRFARTQDMIFSLVLDMNDSRIHPAAGSADERRFIEYAIARLGAFSNITWDLGDDLDSYRDDRWTHTTGVLIEALDPTSTSRPVIRSTTSTRIEPPTGSASPRSRNGPGRSMLLCSISGAGKRARAASFPKRMRNTAMKTTIRCGRANWDRNPPTLCGARPGKSRWRADTKPRARPPVEEPTSGRIPAEAG